MLPDRAAGRRLHRRHVFDGHPPFWRFQLQGIEDFAAWLTGYAPGGLEVEVRRTLPTTSGFVTEHDSSQKRDGEELTSCAIVLCEVRNGRIASWSRQNAENVAFARLYTEGAAPFPERVAAITSRASS